MQEIVYDMILQGVVHMKDYFFYHAALYVQSFLGLLIAWKVVSARSASRAVMI